VLDALSTAIRRLWRLDATHLEPISIRQAWSTPNIAINDLWFKNKLILNKNMTLSWRFNEEVTFDDEPYTSQVRIRTFSERYLQTFREETSKMLAFYTMTNQPHHCCARKVSFSATGKKLDAYVSYTVCTRLLTSEMTVILMLLAITV